MRLRTTIAAILLATAFPAWADDDSGVSAYAGLRGSLAFQNSIHETDVVAAPPSSTKIKINSNLGGGGSIFWGVNLPYGFRTELELLYRYMPLSNASISFSDGTAPLSGSISGAGRFFAPMLNAYWDIPVDDLGVQPFIGGGLGYAWNELGISAPGVPVDNGESWQMAYNLMAGVSAPVGGGARLTAMYRWLHEDLNFTCATGLSCSGALNSQSVDLGLQFAL
jgi:opacity protein-like surface antigen